MKKDVNKDSQGFYIGHANNAYTGVTTILAPKGAVAGVDVRGGAPGTRETDLLKGCHLVEKIHSVTLCGGSAYGLEACDGVMRYLYDNDMGFETGTHKVPLVSGAVIFDLNDPSVLRHPNKLMGYVAASNADEISACETGSVGAGVGATIGKVAGIPARSGFGLATIEWMGATVTAAVVVNAIGDVWDEKTNTIVSGAKTATGEFVDTEGLILSGAFGSPSAGTNTTIGCVMTDAKLTREQANKMASVAHNGLARSIRPVHTMSDGDTIFCMSQGEKDVNFIGLCAVGAEAMRRAVINAVEKTKNA